MHLDPLPTAYVAAMFLAYLGLWRLKRLRQRRATGVDPEVLGQAVRPIQRYFGQLLRVLTGALVLLLLGHAAGVAWPGFQRLPALEARWVDHVGFAVSMAGLALCALAQATMGAAWRVGIDERRRTELVDTGLFAVVRNPTYLGLFAMSAGLWLIWPTASIGAFALVFFVTMEMQVRCEEEHLEALHGDAYRSYRERTWRYLPFLY